MKIRIRLITTLLIALVAVAMLGEGQNGGNLDSDVGDQQPGDPQHRQGVERSDFD